ncbi:MAG: DUF393 domain-containing protein [Phycisphaerales bacterium]|nr:DUF393 domain-containing protein [Phycisphaerales bacterium]
MTDAPLVLFDGACGMCTRSVRWIIRHDRRCMFKFASLRSRAARAAIEAAGADAALCENVTSLVVIDGARVLTESDAVIAVAARLGPPWSLARCGRVVPRPVRNAAYRCIARRRHRGFGGGEVCALASAEIRARFLDAGEPQAQHGVAGDTPLDCG